MAGSREDSPSRLVSDYLFFLFFSFFFSFWEMMAGFGAHSDFFFFFLSSFFFSLSRDPLVRSAHGKDHLAELLGADRYRRYPLSGPDRLRGGRGQDGGLPLSNSFPFYFIFFNSQPVFDFFFSLFLFVDCVRVVLIEKWCRLLPLCCCCCFFEITMFPSTPFLFSCTLGATACARLCWCTLDTSHRKS